MKSIQFISLLFSLFFSGLSIAQNDSETDNVGSPSLFTEAESEYVDQWFEKFV